MKRALLVVIILSGCSSPSYQYVGNVRQQDVDLADCQRQVRAEPNTRRQHELSPIEAAKLSPEEYLRYSAGMRGRMMGEAVAEPLKVQECMKTKGYEIR
jgi:hypothetical protein